MGTRLRQIPVAMDMDIAAQPKERYALLTQYDLEIMDRVLRNVARMGASDVTFGGFRLYIVDNDNARQLE